MWELWEAVRRGAPMSRKTLWRGLEVLGIMVLVASILLAPFYTSLIDNPWYKGLTWFFIMFLMVVFAVAIGLMPYWGEREMKHDVERHLQTLSGLDRLRNSQRDELLNNPMTYLDVRIKRISFRIVNRDEGYMFSELFVTNGTVFDLTLDWEAQKTTCEHINHVGMASIHFSHPNITNKVSTIPLGRTVNQLRIEQTLPGSIIPDLQESIGQTVVKWKFSLSLTFSFEGKRKTQVFNPEWEGIHPRT